MTLSPKSAKAARCEETVPRVAYLRLQRQLTEERCQFLRELCALRNTIQSMQIQQQQQANLFLLQETNRDSEGMFASAASGGNLKRRYMSNLRENSPNSSPGGSQAHLLPTPSPELVSRQNLNEALNAAQVIAELNELHSAELAEKEREVAQLKKDFEEREDEVRAACCHSIKQIRHEHDTVCQTLEKERERYRTEAIAALGDDLRREKSTVAELSKNVERMQSSIFQLQRQVEERDQETRRLRAQIGSLQQDLVHSGVERTECRAALMAISSEKLLLEKKLRQMEHARAQPSSPQLSSNKRGSFVGFVNRSPPSSSRSGSPQVLSQPVACTTSATNEVRSPRAPDYAAATRRTAQRNRDAHVSNSATAQLGKKKDQALTELLDFALDGTMANNIAKRVEKIKQAEALLKAQ